jgi:hypothetical protein
MTLYLVMAGQRQRVPAIQKPKGFPRGGLATATQQDVSVVWDGRGYRREKAHLQGAVADLPKFR